MIVPIFVLLILISLLNSGVIGALIAFLCSRPDAMISAKRLAVISLLVRLIQDALVFAFLMPLDLTITTGSQPLINLLGTSDVTDALTPSFSLFDCVFYAIDVAVAVLIGRFVVSQYRKKYSGVTIPEHAVSENAS